MIDISIKIILFCQWKSPNLTDL